MSRIIIALEPASMMKTQKQWKTSLWRIVGVNVRNIADKLGISVGSVQTIIHERLGYRKIMVRWVPRLLNFEQKLTGWEICMHLL